MEVHVFINLICRLGVQKYSNSLFLNKGLARIWTIVEKPCQITQKTFLFITFLRCFLKEWLSSF